ncbi:MAG: hypothetical protein ACYSUN_12315 [Planctomycetota bacterium]|jgi:chromosome segregation ATPase
MNDKQKILNSWIDMATTMSSIEDSGEYSFSKKDIEAMRDMVIESMSEIDYKEYNKNDRGDIIAKTKNAPKYIKDPLTNDEFPVYSEEEEGILEDIYKTEDSISELEDWYTNEQDLEERVNIKSDIEAYKELLEEYKDHLSELRNEDGWLKKKAEAKAKEIAKKKKAKAKAAKKKKEKEAEEKRLEKEAAKRKEVLDSVPDNLRNQMKNLFG